MIKLSLVPYHGNTDLDLSLSLEKQAFYGPNQFAIVYGIEVGIDRPGALKLDVKTKKKFELRNRPVKIAGKAMTAGPETCAINGFFSKRGR